MKITTIILLLALFWIATEPNGGHIQNPNIVRTDCPWGMSDDSLTGCEIDAPGWFCALATPDGWSVCDSGGIVGMPYNQHGNFQPAKEGIGFFAWLPTIPATEAIGNALQRPISRGCWKARIRLKASVQSDRVSAFWFICGDSVKVQPVPSNSWQTVHIWGATKSRVDTITIGGYAGSDIPKPGFLTSCYYIISFVGLWPDTCGRPVLLDLDGKRLDSGIK